jgi:GGDEF domain-containing protein
MRRAASKTMKWNEEHSAHSDKPLVPGAIITIDLDRFGEYVEERGLDPYKPNTVTSELTRLVEEFARRFQGVVVYGLDYERGTEEAVIEIPYGAECLDQIISELEYIASRVRELGVTVTAVVATDYVTARPARDRREAYRGTPGRRRALRALREAKRRGGNRVVVLA